MGKNWWDEGIPEEGESGGSGSGGSGYAWWQRKTEDEEQFPPRLYIKSGQKREVSFVDEKCFRVWEHSYWIDGRPGFATCTKKISGNCPLCSAGNKAYEVGFFTVIDHTGYTDREGKEHKDYVSLLPAKHYTLDLLRNKYEMHEGLKGKKFLVYRTTNQKAPTVGDDWNHLGPIEIPDDVEPCDYKEVLQPFGDDDMKQIARLGEWRGKKFVKASSVGSSGYTDEEDVDYDDEDDGGTVPF